MRQLVVDQGAQPVRNLAVDPRATAFRTVPLSWWNNRWNGYQTYSIVSGATDGPPGTGIATYARGVVTTAGRTSLGYHLAENPEVGSPSGSFLIPAVPGQTVTMSIWFRVSIACTAVLRIRPAGGNGNWNGGVSTPVSKTMAAGTWTRFTVSTVVPAGMFGLAAAITINEALAIGDTFDGTAMMFTATSGPADHGIHLDGGSPGWRWLGTAGASESAGYPYTLESIAGRPLASVTGAGTSSAPLGLTAFEGRTLYVVHDVFDTASNLASLAAIGATSASGPGRATLRTAAGTGTNIELRAEPVSGGAITFSTRAGVRTVGRHVSVGSMADALASSTVMVDGLTGPVTAFTAGGGMSIGSSNLLNLGPLSTSDNPSFALAYRGEHDDETKRRITAWLARKYGAPIPAGY